MVMAGLCLHQKVRNKEKLTELKYYYQKSLKSSLGELIANITV